MPNAPTVRAVSLRTSAPFASSSRSTICIGFVTAADARHAEIQRRIAALMAAYDPCVRFEVETQALQEEGIAVMPLLLPDAFKGQLQ